MKLLAKLNAVFERTIDIMAFLAGMVIVYVMLSIFLEVTVRKLFNTSQPWVVEIGEHSILYIAFLGAAWLLKSDGHVKMDLLVNRLKPRPQAFLNMIMSIIGALLCLIIGWYGVLVTVDLYQRGIYYPRTMELPMPPLIGIIGPGGFLLSIQFLKRAYGYFVSWKVGIKPEVEVEVVEI